MGLLSVWQVSKKILFHEHCKLSSKTLGRRDEMGSGGSGVTGGGMINGWESGFRVGGIGWVGEDNKLGMPPMELVFPTSIRLVIFFIILS